MTEAQEVSVKNGKGTLILAPLKKDDALELPGETIVRPTTPAGRLKLGLPAGVNIIYPGGPDLGSTLNAEGSVTLDPGQKAGIPKGDTKTVTIGAAGTVCIILGGENTELPLTTFPAGTRIILGPKAKVDCKGRSEPLKKEKPPRMPTIFELGDGRKIKFIEQSNSTADCEAILFDLDGKGVVARLAGKTAIDGETVAGTIWTQPYAGEQGKWDIVNYRGGNTGILTLSWNDKAEQKLPVKPLN
ncbi:MAG: hypothetical protein V1875_04580 [Candidatus Altiarchaeota archaeon]